MTREAPTPGTPSMERPGTTLTEPRTELHDEVLDLRDEVVDQTNRVMNIARSVGRTAGETFSKAREVIQPRMKEISLTAGGIATGVLITNRFMHRQQEKHSFRHQFHEQTSRAKQKIEEARTKS